MAFPSVEFIQFSKDVDPSGFRDISASGIKVLDTSVTGCLDFGNTNTTTSGSISETKLLIFRATDLADASGIYNLKFFLDSGTAFNTGSYRFLYKTATHFQGPGFQLELTDADLPVSEPASQNVISTSGAPTISGIFDGHVSQYIYLAVYVDTDVPYGSYGGCSAGSFRYKMIYDFS
jgi:hypothetical protein